MKYYQYIPYTTTDTVFRIDIMQGKIEKLLRSKLRLQCTNIVEKLLGKRLYWSKGLRKIMIKNIGDPWGTERVIKL